MGRSSGDSAGLEPPEPSHNQPDSAGDIDTDNIVRLASPGTDASHSRRDPLRAVGIVQKQLLENVRRALGKLVTHTKVHDIAIAEAGQYAVVSTNDVLDVVVPPGSQGEDHLLIAVTDHPAGIPSADPGGGGIDLATVVTVISANSAVNAAVTESYAVDVAYAETRAYELPKPQWGLDAREPVRVDTDIHGGDVREFSLDRVSTVATGSLPIDRFHAAVATRPSVTEALQPMRIGVRTSLARAYQIPLVRRSSITRRGHGMNMKERERLAIVAKIAIENVALIGLFRNVPVTAVSRLSVEEDAAELLIWLKPEAARSATPPKLVDLLIGRDAATGKMIQTVA